MSQPESSSAAQLRAHPPWLGGLASSMAVCITHPIDQTKIRSQTQYPRLGMLATAGNTITKEGVIGLWNGLSGSILRQATYGAVRFGVYNELKERDKRKGKKDKGKLNLMKNGAIAGVFAGIAGAPGELVMVRMCADGVKAPEKRLHYKNAIQGLWRIYKDEGLKSIFRGTEATVLRSVIMNTFQLSCYDIIKARLLLTGYLHEGPLLHIITAIMGGTIAVTAVAPVDVMKSRIQSSTNPNITSLQIVSRSLRREGFMVLFRGWLPAWLRMSPTTALTFVFFEQLKRIF